MSALEKTDLLLEERKYDNSLFLQSTNVAEQLAKQSGEENVKTRSSHKIFTLEAPKLQPTENQSKDYINTLFDYLEQLVQFQCTMSGNQSKISDYMSTLSTTNITISQSIAKQAQTDETNYQNQVAADDAKTATTATISKVLFWVSIATIVLSALTGGIAGAIIGAAFLIASQFKCVQSAIQTGATDLMNGISDIQTHFGLPAWTKTAMMIIAMIVICVVLLYVTKGADRLLGFCGDITGISAKASTIFSRLIEFLGISPETVSSTGKILTTLSTAAKFTTGVLIIGMGINQMEQGDIELGIADLTKKIGKNKSALAIEQIITEILNALISANQTADKNVNNDFEAMSKNNEHLTDFYSYAAEIMA